MDTAEAFESWVAAAVVEEVIASRKAAASALLKAQLLDELAKHLYAKGLQTKTQKLQIQKNGQLDHQANYTVQARFQLEAKTSDELLAKLKVALGDREGQRLFDNEIDTKRVTTLRPLNELLLGHDEGQGFVPATQQEQDIAAKVLAFLRDQKTTPLTEAERDLVLIQQDQMDVKAGFFERVVGYCKSVAELKALLRIIVPLNSLSHAKFGISDTPQERHMRLIQAAADILGEVEEDRIPRTDNRHPDL